jgi:hypothetical protein
MLAVFDDGQDRVVGHRRGQPVPVGRSVAHVITVLTPILPAARYHHLR